MKGCCGKCIGGYIFNSIGNYKYCTCIIGQRQFQKREPEKWAKHIKKDLGLSLDQVAAITPSELMVIEEVTATFQ